MTRGTRHFHYFVEGQNEKTMLSSIKGYHVQSGKVSVLNVMQQSISSAQLMILGEKTCVILVFDTDVLGDKQIECLARNIRQLEKSRKVTEILTVPQIKNFRTSLFMQLQSRMRRTLQNQIRQRISKRTSTAKRILLQN